MKKRFVLFVMLVAAVLALNCVATAFAANASLDVEANKEISQIDTAGESYTVQGLVVASNTRGVVITDGTAGVMIYGSGVLDVVALGDFIEITATASEYNNILQLEYTSETQITKLETEKPQEPTVQALTPEKAQEWKNAADQDPSGLSVTDVMPYSWTATATRVNNFWALSPDWATDLGFDIEPLYVNSSKFSLQEGVKYNAEGYFIGFNNTSSTPFAGMMLTALKADTDQVMIVVNNPYIAADYNETASVELNVTITGTSNTDFTVTSSDATVASWTSGNKVNIEGVGTTTLTVTSLADTTKSANATLVVYDQIVDNFADLTDVGTYQVSGNVVAKTTNAAIVADATGGVMVYDIKQVSALEIGDTVKVSGTVSQYMGLWQFSYNPGVVVEKIEKTPYTPAETKLADNAALEAVISELSQADVKLYSWTAVAGLKNGYNVYSLSYDGVVVEAEVALSDIELGTTYDLQGYFVGYDATNKYASFVITEYNAVPEAEQQTYLGFNRNVIYLGTNSSYTLSPILGGAAKGATVEYTGYNQELISVENSIVTALAVGDTEITATVAGISRTLEVHVSNAISQIETPNQFYTVIGKVVAKTTQSLVIHDGTAGILVYDRDAVATYDLDAILQVSGYVSLYNNMLQFSYSGSLSITKLEDREINVPDPTELQPEKATEWATMASPILPINCQAYTWSAKVGKSGNFFTINIDGSSTVIEPAYMPDTFTLTEGETVTVTGYFIGYATGNKYAAIAITKIVHAEG